MEKDMAYKGYMIKHTLTGATFVTWGIQYGNAALICWAKDNQDAQRKIDELVE
jgi:hypothetical protein